MYKLIDCGTYVWFVKKSNKYFHCVYSVDGEHKKLSIKNNYLKNISEKTKYSNLKSFLSYEGFEKQPCIINNKTHKFYNKIWKRLNKTLLMKEVLKQLKLGEKI